jgi:hypothetical protein
LRRLTGEKTKKYRRGQKTKITAALVTDITAAVKLDRRQTIRHIGLVLGVHTISLKNLGLDKKLA